MPSTSFGLFAIFTGLIEPFFPSLLMFSYIWDFNLQFPVLYHFIPFNIESPIFTLSCKLYPIKIHPSIPALVSRKCSLEHLGTFPRFWGQHVHQVFVKI